MKDNLADILASCLESMERGERSADELPALHPEHRSELETLLKTAALIKERADFAPRPGFRLSSRARLFRILETARAPKPFHIPKLSRKPALAWAALLVLVISIIGGGTVHASNAALPGDTLHPVKLLIEDARLFVSDDAGKASLAIEHVDTRLQEIQALAAADGQDEDLNLAVSLLDGRIATATNALSTLAQYDPQRAAQLAILFETTLAHHAGALTSQLEFIPEKAKPALEQALRVSLMGQQAAHDLIQSTDPNGAGEPIEDAASATPEPADTPSEDSPAPAATPPGMTPGPAATPPGGGPPENIPGPFKTPPAGPPENAPGPPTSVPGNRP